MSVLNVILLSSRYYYSIDLILHFKIVIRIKNMSQIYKFCCLIVLLLLIFIITPTYSQEYYKQKCHHCEGRKRTADYIGEACPNCTYWTNYQKQANPCRVCKNKRRIYRASVVCGVCKGTGIETIRNLTQNLKEIYSTSNGTFLSIYSSAIDREKKECWQAYKYHYVNSEQIYFDFHVSSDPKTTFRLAYYDNGDAVFSFFNSLDNYSFNGRWFFNGEVQVANKHFTTEVEIAGKIYSFNSNFPCEGIQKPK